LSLPSEDRTTPVRAGFLVQFLVIVAWALSFMNETARATAAAVQVLGTIGGLHLAAVATFAVTEDLAWSRRVRRQLANTSRLEWLLGMLRPGGARGALYIVAQLCVLLVAGTLLDAGGLELRWLAAIGGYICFMTGVPTWLVRWLKPDTPALYLRVGIFLLFAASIILPDMVYYTLWRPDNFSVQFSARHLLNPLRTLANWAIVEYQYPLAWAMAPGVIGVLAYTGLFIMGSRAEAAGRAQRTEPSPTGHRVEEHGAGAAN
jgi:hypothetical protein